MVMPPPPPPPPPPRPPPPSSSSASASDPSHHHHHPHHHHLPNTTIPLSSNPSRPPPSPLYTAQPLLPVLPKTNQIHPLHMSKIQDSSSTPPPPQGIVYPVAAARGFHHKSIRSSQPSDQMVTVANPIGYPLASGRNPPLVGFPTPVRPFGFPVDHMRPPPVQGSGSFVVSRPMGTTNSGVLKGIPAAVPPKVNQPPTMSSSSEYNSYKDLRDKNKDDAVVVTIHDRKVRLSDGGSGSLYSLCRSWVRNGLPQESQPHFGDGIKLLPRPLVDGHTSKRTEPEEDEEKDEHAGSIENLSAHDLLQGHIKRAKRVRARLSEERLQRIERYKQRLALLLPPPIETNRVDAGDAGS